MQLLNKYKDKYKRNEKELLSLEDYLKLAKRDSSVYASAAERMLKAIGEPKVLDTSKDRRLSRIFGNRIIRTYPTFEDFYGLELVIDKIVSFFRHAAQGLEESRQILYLLGPVGSAKSSIAERLKSLMEQEPIYVLADKNGKLSPVLESPLGLFDIADADGLKIPERYLTIKASPWALKRTEEYQGDISQFTVAKIYPNQNRQLAISKTEPGDENNQDISTLVGKLDIRKLEFHSQNDPDAYNYSGGLCTSNQGLLEFVEMFKAPIKILNPLLTATQEKNYKGTEAIPAIPFDGIVLAHSNESEWETFKNNKNNEAFLDRVYIVEVPYCLRINEEVKIYKKLLKGSSLRNANIAPGTLELLAKFMILTRLDTSNQIEVLSKAAAYNGENPKEKNIRAKTHQEYKDLAAHSEGFTGLSTRLAYKILAETFNYDIDEVSADPVHLLHVLHETLKRERIPDETLNLYQAYIRKGLMVDFAKQLEKDIQTAYLDSYDDYGQALFDRYIKYADYWIQDNDFRDPDTGEMFSTELLNEELEKLEKPAEIANPKDFRHEVVNFALRHQANNEGTNPDWKAYEKLRRVVEASMFSKTESLLPVISFTGQGTKEDKVKHERFIEGMLELGYTKKQVKRMVEWHMRYNKSE